MTKDKSLPLKYASPGDAAVNGLFGGLGAGGLMTIFLALTGLVSGSGAGTFLGYFALSESASPLQGVLAHLAVSGVYGMLFGVGLRSVRGRRLSRVPGWILGMGYGILLWILAQVVILPGTESPLHSIPPGLFAVAHLVYGLALGFFTHRK